MLSHVLSQSLTRRHAVGFGGKAAKADDKTKVNWNDVTANARERVGIKQHIIVRFW